MRSAPLIACLAAVAAVGSPALARGGTTTTAPAMTVTVPQAAPTQPRAAVEVCRSAVAAGDRAAVFSGSMPPLADAYRMKMRFDLYTRRQSGDAWRRIDVPKWGVWHTSKPRVPGFVFTKFVNGLDAPASYRVVVRFRWYDDRSRLLRQMSRTSPVCAELGPNADLQFGAITATAQANGQARYAIVVRNAGLKASGEFTVGLSIDGVKKTSPPAADLVSGQERTVLIDAPACTGKKLLLTADPKDVDTDVDRHTAPVARPCPA